jgi:ferrochelatase
MSTQNKTAVLLMAYGSPENLDEVAQYYTHIRGGVRPDEALITSLEDRYRAVGGKTPLHEVTRAQAAALQKMFDEKHPDQFKVFIGMKHWHPFIKDTLEEIRADEITDIIAIALAPHYSQISIGGYKKILDELKKENETIHLIESWHTNTYLISCIVEQIQEKIKDFETIPYILFTAHSLPERIRTWNDPYESQLLETAELIAKEIKQNFPNLKWGFSFQSAGMMGGPWIGPDINENLITLKSKDETNILVCPIGFVSDNLEIVYDLDIESKKIGEENKINLKRTDMRNTHPLFIQALYEEILKAKDAN